VYRTEESAVDVSPGRVLGLNHGINNWLTGVSNVGTSFIILTRLIALAIIIIFTTSQYHAITP